MVPVRKTSPNFLRFVRSADPSTPSKHASLVSEFTVIYLYPHLYENWFNHKVVSYINYPMTHSHPVYFVM